MEQRASILEMMVKRLFSWGCISSYPKLGHARFATLKPPIFVMEWFILEQHAHRFCTKTHCTLPSAEDTGTYSTSIFTMFKSYCADHFLAFMIAPL